MCVGGELGRDPAPSPGGAGVTARMAPGLLDREVSFTGTSKNTPVW